MTPITEDEIGEHICAVLNKSGIDDGHATLILMGVLAGILTSISCKECRRVHAEVLRKTLGTVISDAMNQPGMNQPGDANHIH